MSVQVHSCRYASYLGVVSEAEKADATARQQARSERLKTICGEKKGRLKELYVRLDGYIEDVGFMSDGRSRARPARIEPVSILYPFSPPASQRSCLLQRVSQDRIHRRRAHRCDRHYALRHPGCGADAVLGSTRRPRASAWRCSPCLPHRAPSCPSTWKMGLAELSKDSSFAALRAFICLAMFAFTPLYHSPSSVSTMCQRQRCRERILR